MPILILVALCGYTFWKLPSIEDVPANHINIHVEAQQFSWTVTYPNGKSTPGAKITLVAPVNTPVELHINSKDVIHDWWVPALGQKVDAIPGQTNHIWFRGDAHRHLPRAVRRVLRHRARRHADLRQDRDSRRRTAAS